MLGAIGIAGVTARTIAERMPEFGVRLALGCAAGTSGGTSYSINCRSCSRGHPRRRARHEVEPPARLDVAGNGPVRWAVVAGAVVLLAATAIAAAAFPGFPSAASESVGDSLFEGLAPLELPTRSLAGPRSPLRSRGSLAALVRAALFSRGSRPSNSPTRSLAGAPRPRSGRVAHSLRSFALTGVPCRGRPFQ